MKLNRKNKKGFTIVELVIVIAVIGILSAVLIPTFVNLSNQAQETAKKQQVADAYTAYLVEATDNKYDNLYTYNSSTSKYVAADVKIANKAQKGVAMNLNGEWFTYTADKGWEKKDAEGTKKLVVEHYSAAVTADNALYLKVENNYNPKTVAAQAADKANEALSTFNGVLVYYIAA